MPQKLIPAETNIRSIRFGPGDSVVWSYHNAAKKSFIVAHGITPKSKAYAVDFIKMETKPHGE